MARKQIAYWEKYKDKMTADQIISKARLIFDKKHIVFQGNILWTDKIKVKLSGVK